MSQRFCLFFVEKRGELFEKNKQKTRFVKHAYPVYKPDGDGTVLFLTPRAGAE